jgi:endonuclease YncB( thermonuclease family)
MRSWRQIFLLTVIAVSVQAEWTILQNCQLVENQSNDGDSFVIECSTPYRGEMQNRFRLYFVDTAETDSNSDFKRERLKEQAAYWGSDNLDFALQMGLRAEQNVKKWMRGGFTVYTQGGYAPSMGAPRYYAMIRIQDRWLDEMLVENGLARIYGDSTELPEGISAESHWHKLHELERAARTAGLNGWSYATVAEPVSADEKAFARHDSVLVRDAWIYSIKDGGKVMALLKGTKVSVLAPDGSSRVRIRFERNGTVYEGLCEKANLEP